MIGIIGNKFSKKYSRDLKFKRRIYEKKITRNIEIWGWIKLIINWIS